MAVLLFTTQSLFDGNMWDTLRQYFAGISIEWPDLSEQWANFSEWLSQPRKPTTSSCHQPPVVVLNDRQMSWP